MRVERVAHYSFGRSSREIILERTTECASNRAFNRASKYASNGASISWQKCVSNSSNNWFDISHRPAVTNEKVTNIRRGIRFALFCNCATYVPWIVRRTYRGKNNVFHTRSFHIRSLSIRSFLCSIYCRVNCMFSLDNSCVSSADC